MPFHAAVPPSFARLPSAVSSRSASSVSLTDGTIWQSMAEMLEPAAVPSADPGTQLASQQAAPAAAVQLQPPATASRSASVQTAGGQAAPAFSAAALLAPAAGEARMQASGPATSTTAAQGSQTPTDPAVGASLSEQAHQQRRDAAAWQVRPFVCLVCSACMLSSDSLAVCIAEVHISGERRTWQVARSRRVSVGVSA